MTYAAKGYFDALVKMGELASESQGSKELGKTPTQRRPQMAARPSHMPGRGWGPSLGLVLLPLGIRFSSNKKLF